MLAHSNILGLFFFFFVPRKCCVRVGGVFSVYHVDDSQRSASLVSYIWGGQDGICVGLGGCGVGLSCQTALRDLGDIMHLRV